LFIFGLRHCFIWENTQILTPVLDSFISILIPDTNATKSRTINKSRRLQLLIVWNRSYMSVYLCRYTQKWGWIGRKGSEIYTR